MINYRREFLLIMTLSVIIILLSALSISLNNEQFHYAGISYVPEETPKIFSILVLLCLGSYLHTGSNSRITQILLHLFAYYVVLFIIMLFTNAIQYTPFPGIDEKILDFQGAYLNELFTRIITWTHQHMALGHFFVRIYNSLSMEVLVVPILLVLFQQRTYLYEYFILILITALLGFIFYYFFPSSGPASILPPQYFTHSQLATGIKFTLVHQHIQPSSLEGGLIALPSYHTIWAWLSTFAFRKYKPIFAILLIYNGTIMAACILLGWHYFVDLIGSFLVLLLAHGICIMHKTAAKWRKSSSEDHAGVDQIGISNHTIT